jgi:hypothetical protein
MSLRGVFFNPRKLRAVWRLLLFLAVATVVARALSWAISILGVGGSGTLWAIFRTHSTLALSLLIASLVMMRGVEHKPVAALGFPWGGEALIGFLKGAAIGVLHRGFNDRPDAGGLAPAGA